VCWRSLRTRIVWIGTRVAFIRAAREGKEISDVVWVVGKQRSVAISIVDICGSKEILPVHIIVTVVEVGLTQPASRRKSTTMPRRQEIHDSKSTDNKDEAENSNAATGGRCIMVTASLGEPNASLTRIHDDQSALAKRDDSEI
jgi:hypothetical protein